MPQRHFPKKKKKTIVKQDSRRQENMELDLLGLY